MKRLIEFDIDKFISELKKLNHDNGYSSLKEDSTEDDMYRVAGWQNCMEVIVNLFEECWLGGSD